MSKIKACSHKSSWTYLILKTLYLHYLKPFIGSEKTITQEDILQQIIHLKISKKDRGFWGRFCRIDSSLRDLVQLTFLYEASLT